MSIKNVKESVGSIQGLIGEYEEKTDKPTLEGFSMWLERKKQYWVTQYREHQWVMANAKRRRI